MCWRYFRLTYKILPNQRSKATSIGDSMPDFHAEPYIYLAGLTHKAALIAWGAFYFRTRSDGRMKIVDDHDLQWVHPPRCDSIGCRSKPFGPAIVEVRDRAGRVVATAL